MCLSDHELLETVCSVELKLLELSCEKKIPYQLSLSIGQSRSAVIGSYMM